MNRSVIQFPRPPAPTRPISSAEFACDTNTVSGRSTSRPPAARRRSLRSFIASVPHSKPFVPAHRFVARIDDAVDDVTVLVRFARSDTVANTFHKVAHLGLVTVR